MAAAFALLLPAAGRAAPSLPRVVSEGPATQFAAAQYVLHSGRVGRDFLVKVTPPFSPVPAGERRPVIYALDGGYEVAGPMGWMLGGAGAMAQAYVVSVGYLPADFARRDGDLAFKAYVDNGRSVPAGGPAFEAFLLDELEPFVQARFPADPGQAYLFGHSAGGLFAAEVFAARPGAFRGYLIASPGVRRDPDVLARVARAARDAAGARIYLAVGGAEAPFMLDDERRLAAALAGPGSHVTLRRRTYAGATHLSYYPRLIADAFPWLLPPTAAPAIPPVRSALPPGAIILPGSKADRLLSQCSRGAPPKGGPTWDPTPQDIRELEARLPAAVGQGLMGGRADWSKAPGGWVRQYVGVFRDGRRVIYGNFFPGDAADSRGLPTEPVIICDGGPVFFGVEYDVETKRITYVEYNGLA